jgi:UDP-N-acetylglucosamine acyltransferase
VSPATIDPTARIERGATIGHDVTIGPYCVIGPHVAIGDGCRLMAHVHVTGHTTIGSRTVIHPFASLGTPPQSVKYRGGPTRLIVGADCDIREGVTFNTGTEDDRGITEIGDRCFFMVGSHVGHDCKVGSDVTFANNVVLGGHVTIGDFVVFGGQAAVRQFVRIGEGAMIVGLSGVRADVIPFGLVQGPLAELIGLNVVGMRRRGFARADIHRLRQAYQALFFGAGTFRERLERLAARTSPDPLIAKVIAFIRAGSRPLTMAVRRAQAGQESGQQSGQEAGQEPGQES